MTATETWIEDLAPVRPGDPIEVWDELSERCTGTVEEVAPDLGVLWVVETRTQTRRMFSTDDCRLRHPHLAPAA